MNCYNIILEYINSSPKGTPIFIEEIKEHIIKFYNENYKYLQLFDLIENKDHIGIEAKNPDGIIYQFIKENDLDFEKIIKYAMDTKSRSVINKILVLAR